MTIEAWAREHLISAVPADLSVWHWTRTGESERAIQEIIRAGGDFSNWGEGAIGRGLYLSTSAIDLIDKGQEVIHARLPAGTRVLMVDTDLFGVGVGEIMDIALRQLGWKWKPAPWRGRVDPAQAQPARVVIPSLLERLELPACAYIFGFHLAFMVRTGACLRVDQTIDAARTVAEYVKAHPKERPTLVSADVVKRWLADRVGREHLSGGR